MTVAGQAGKNVVECLNEAMKRQGLDMRVSALVCLILACWVHTLVSYKIRST